MPGVIHGQSLAVHGTSRHEGRAWPVAIREPDPARQGSGGIGLELRDGWAPSDGRSSVAMKLPLVSSPFSQYLMTP
jgi:hypothetical protein